MSTFYLGPETITPVNSTTYVDMLGVNVGLTRLPGESASEFMKRVTVMGNIPQNYAYASMLQRIATELGLSTYVGIQLTATTPVVVTCSISGLVITSLNGSIQYVSSPLLTIAQDNVWSWRMLSNIVSDINITTTTSGVTATLIQDRLALCLSKQTNYLWTQESVDGWSHTFQQKNPQISTITFNMAVPSYTIHGSTILFSSEVPVEATITYVYVAMPFDVVVSDVGMFGLTDPAFATIATNGSILTQQAMEILNDVMTRDRSYWTK